MVLQRTATHRVYIVDVRLCTEDKRRGVCVYITNVCERVYVCVHICINICIHNVCVCIYITNHTHTAPYTQYIGAYILHVYRRIYTQYVPLSIYAPVEYIRAQSIYAPIEYICAYY